MSSREGGRWQDRAESSHWARDSAARASASAAMMASHSARCSARLAAASLDSLGAALRRSCATALTSSSMPPSSTNASAPVMRRLVIL